MKTGEDAWQVLNGVLRDKEMLGAMRASGNAECQWFIGWVDDVYYPWRARGTGSLWPPTAPATQFFPRIEKAIAAACRARATGRKCPIPRDDASGVPRDDQQQAQPRRTVLRARRRPAR